jgi:hypothetical protein
MMRPSAIGTLLAAPLVFVAIAGAGCGQRMPRVGSHDVGGAK